MTHTKNLVPFYRAIAGLPIQRQREACEAAAKRLGLRLAPDYTATDAGDDLAEWRRGLTAADIGIVANLMCIPDWRAKGSRPGSVLTETVLDLAHRKIMLMSALDALSSADGTKWIALVRTSQDALARGGRKMPRKHYQKMARKSHEKRPRGVIKRWHSPTMAKVLEANARIWRDPIFKGKGDAARFAALPEDVQSDMVTASMARAVFKAARPGDKSAGGRPRKRKPRK